MENNSNCFKLSYYLYMARGTGGLPKHIQNMIGRAYRDETGEWVVPGTFLVKAAESRPASVRPRKPVPGQPHSVPTERDRAAAAALLKYKRG